MYHTLIKSLILVISIFLIACSNGDNTSVTLWVSTNTGDDSNDGTFSKPFKSIQQARDKVREINETDDKNIVVYIREGTYRFNSTLELDSRDSGKNMHNVIYKAYNGEHPIITGSIEVTDWTISDASNNIYAANVGQVSSRQLYVNGNRATRAKTALDPGGYLPKYHYSSDASEIEKKGILYIPLSTPDPLTPNPSQWKNISNIEAVISTQWKMMRVPLKSIKYYDQYDEKFDINISGTIVPINFKTGLIELQEPAWTNANLYLDANTTQPSIWSFFRVTYFENAYEFLDEPGEWYLDKNAGVLYYKPLVGENMFDVKVELPVLETLINAAGTENNPICNIQFEGLTFAYATWLEPSGNNGYVADQSGNRVLGYGHNANTSGHVENTTPTPGNINFVYARNVSFIGNIFEHLGAVGLYFGTASQDNTIQNNLFEDISSSAIQLGGFSIIDHHPTSANQITLNNTIKNNLIKSTGKDYYDSAAIFVGFNQNTLIDHNTIYDVPWSGIAMGWGWGLLDPGSFTGLANSVSGEWGDYTTNTPNKNNRITNNRIQNFLMKLWDGGAVYTTGYQGTSDADALLLEGNVATNKRSSAGSNIFYTDGGSRYITLKNNVSYNNPIGVIDFGSKPSSIDPFQLVYDIYTLANGFPYGGDKGGCRTYGNISYIRNHWTKTDFYDPCPFSLNGVSYPTSLTYIDNYSVLPFSPQVQDIKNSSGVMDKPSTIPDSKWTVPEINW